MGAGRSAAAFINGLGSGLSLMRNINQFRDEEDMRDIADQGTEQSTGFDADQGKKLEELAASGKYNIEYDDSTQAYKATPKDGTSPAVMVSQQGVTDFMGKRYSGADQEAQAEKARQLAIAGVVGRSDPAKAASIRRDIKMGERDDARWDREQKQWAKQDEADAFTTGLEKDVGAYMKGRLTNADGSTRPASPDDYLASSQYRLSKLIEAGKADEAEKVMKDYSSQAFIKIRMEDAERDQALGKTIAAVNSGNLQAAAQFYDRFLPDGASVTGIQKGVDGSITVQRTAVDGKPAQPMTFKDVNHLTASLAALKDPMAVYNYSQNEFRNSLALRQDARAGAADARAARAEGRAIAADERSKSEAAKVAEAGMALYQERNPGASQAELNAVRAGVLPATPKASSYKVEAGDIATMLGTPAVDAQGAPITDPMSGRQVVNRNPQREQALYQFMQRNGITDTNEGLLKFVQAEASGGAAGAAAPQSGGAAQAGQRVGNSPYPEGTELKGKDGKVYIVKGGKPVPK